MKNATKNTTMKNIFNIVIVAFVALALTLSTTSCKKEEVNPSTPNNNNNNGGNNTAPTVVASFSSNVITVTASDVDGSISKVEVLEGSTVKSTLTSAPYTYSVPNVAGTYTYTIKAYDDKNSVSSTTVTFTISSTNPTNNAPTFSATSLKITSNGSAQTFALPVSDSDGNTVTITSITGASSNVAVTYSGLNVTVTPNNSVFAGSEALTITVTDGTTPTTSSFTVNVGETAQINSYNALSSYFTQTLGGSFKIMTNGTITGGNDADFYESGSTSATYKIVSNGNIQVYVAGLTIEYSFTTPSSNNIEFTLVSTTNGSYSSAIGQTFLF
jgi:hypothetical protein